MVALTRPPCPRPAALLLGALLAVTALPAAALFKVVAPDGSVTYTDRPPPNSPSRVITLGRSAEATSAPEPVLPPELRQAMQRFPVTLYTASDCAPCDSGRQLLLARGVPFTERTVSSDDDAAALERLSGARTIPVLTIGSQALRGLAQSDWASYLDAAGYPGSSRLPRGWPAAVPAPLVQRAPPPRPTEAAAPAPAPGVSPLPIDPAPNAIRF